ncbi:hypothetical protein JQ617_30490 [Bradyrhizobium sp. KB893862 SZCCT0404]|uniref:hypothetical protein n=1 Tax=Bradyrhizobium sp. KB893862 SZCCT0404 TaxID=2807672 RepID=UPI001BA96309|nr:hypothetical protein [Bradyrhizobium sp. KB893862 SZCCT0404]MBR1178327.1 hypothetical protein [Bradyrhizobium sp. KB893862 SZCCT0404]
MALETNPAEPACCEQAKPRDEVVVRTDRHSCEIALTKIRSNCLYASTHAPVVCLLMVVLARRHPEMLECRNANQQQSWVGSFGTG